MGPDAAPEFCGVKVTEKVALCPAASVTGRESPLNANSELFEEPDEIVTLAPDAVSVAVRALLEPIVALPKLKLAGLSDSCPAVFPVPAIETLRVALDAVDERLRLPLADPVAVGVKDRVKVRLCPGDS